MFFLAPNQLTGTSEKNLDFSGFTLFVHPDFFLNYPLAKKIGQYNSFLMPPLHLSDQEKETILAMAKLKSALPLAEEEPETVRWYALQSGMSTFGIFDTFETEESRQLIWMARSLKL